MRFIGDVHGLYTPYKRLISDVSESIQVGDMGVGFRRSGGGPRDGEIYSNPPHYAMVKGNHRFIRGNHDNPEECAKHSQWIPDGRVEGSMMFCGGAVSIDREFRREGYAWWANEELSAKELDGVMEKYLAAKPKVMVTHDCPESIAEAIFQGIPGAANGEAKLDPRFASRSRQAFQSMWEAHKPKLWIFGHWHESFDKVVEGTRFLCLAELEAKDIDLSLI